MTHNKQQGFTLIEILISSALISLLGLVFVGLQFILSQNQILLFRNSVSIDDGNRNVTTFVRELRSARTADNGSYPLVSVEDNQIIFYSDIDYDGQTERVRYTRNVNTLEKGVIEPIGNPVSYPQTEEKVKTLTEYIRNGTDPIFYYYNGDWPQDTINNPLPLNLRLAQTKSVRIYLKLNTDDLSPDKNYNLESEVQLRMLKDNL